MVVEGRWAGSAVRAVEKVVFGKLPLDFEQRQAGRQASSSVMCRPRDAGPAVLLHGDDSRVPVLGPHSKLCFQPNTTFCIWA